MEQRLAPVAPFLPLAAEKYDPRNIEQITRALRLYFNQLDLTNQATLSELFYLLDAKYGSFYSTADQFAALPNTAYAMTFTATDASATSGIYRGTPTSRIYVPKTNVYNIQFSAQLLSRAGGTHLVWIWFRKNGTVTLPDSATKVTVQGNNTAVVAAWNYAMALNAGDYFEIMWESDDTNVFLHRDPASVVHPAIPSVILTVTKFNT
jgi:hypothetical protein